MLISCIKFIPTHQDLFISSMALSRQLDVQRYWDLLDAQEPVFKYLGMGKNIDLMRVNKTIKDHVESWLRRKQHKLQLRWHWDDVFVLDNCDDSQFTLPIPRKHENISHILDLIPHLRTLRFRIDDTEDRKVEIMRKMAALIVDSPKLFDSLKDIELYLMSIKNHNDKEGLEYSIMAHLPNLERIAVYSKLKPSSSIRRFLKTERSRLKAMLVTIDGWTGWSEENLEQFIEELSISCKYLANLSLDHLGDTILPSTFELCGKLLPQLTGLKFFGYIFTENIPPLTELIRSSPLNKLQWLDLGSDFGHENKVYFMALVQAIAARWPHLHYLRIQVPAFSGPRGFTLPDFKDLLNMLRHVKRLDFSSLALDLKKCDIEDESIANIAMNLTCCDHLYVLNGCEIFVLLRAAPHLEKLKIFANLSLLALLGRERLHCMQPSLLLPALTQIKKLHFCLLPSGSDLDNEEAALMFFESLIHSCPTLKSFQLSMPFVHHHLSTLDFTERFCSIFRILRDHIVELILEISELGLEMFLFTQFICGFIRNAPKSLKIVVRHPSKYFKGPFKQAVKTRRLSNPSFCGLSYLR